MSDAMDDWTGSSDDLQAAEYVLGVQDSNARASASRRAEADAGFAALVAAWEARLVPLSETISPSEVPPHLWAEVERRLGWQSQAQGAVPQKPQSLWNSIGLWRGLAFGSSTLAAGALALALLVMPAGGPATPPPPPPGMPMVAAIATDVGDPMYMAVIDQGSATITVMPMKAPVAGAQVPELWIIGEGEAPISLGVVPDKGMQRAPFPPAHMERAHHGALLAITMEPPGGAPGGKATGPAVAKGAIQSL
ncbi:MAG: anti-sigma factor [Alphaproteobacteria bacterium]|nr:anti-sigma factor [Alphaproteobacteria bacterium]